MEALRSFKEDVIAELVPLIGPRCKFLKGWQRWLEEGAPAPSPSPTSPCTPAYERERASETPTAEPCLAAAGVAPEISHLTRQPAARAPAAPAAPAPLPPTPLSSACGSTASGPAAVDVDVGMSLVSLV